MFKGIATVALLIISNAFKVKNMLFYTRNKLKDYLIKEGVEI